MGQPKILLEKQLFAICYDDMYRIFCYGNMSVNITHIYFAEFVFLIFLNNIKLLHVNLQATGVIFRERISR